MGSKKGSLLGRMIRSVGTLRAGLGTAVAGLSRKKPVPIVRIKKGIRIGKVVYTVHSFIEPVTFTREKDAKAFRELLNSKATVDYNAAIIRREIVDDFIVTYGDEHVEKN